LSKKIEQRSGFLNGDCSQTAPIAKAVGVSVLHFRKFLVPGENAWSREKTLGLGRKHLVQGENAWSREKKRHAEAGRNTATYAFGLLGDSTQRLADG
jgi:hypothetical protein